VTAEISLIGSGYLGQCTVRGAAPRKHARKMHGQKAGRQRELCGRQVDWLTANRKNVHLLTMLLL
jgi:hypothetical protein